jgi:hypothetical protein
MEREKYRLKRHLNRSKRAVISERKTAHSSRAHNMQSTPPLIICTYGTSRAPYMSFRLRMAYSAPPTTFGTFRPTVPQMIGFVTHTHAACYSRRAAVHLYCHYPPTGTRPTYTHDCDDCGGYRKTYICELSSYINNGMQRMHWYQLLPVA